MRKLQIRGDPSASDFGFLVKPDLCAGSIMSSEFGYSDENSTISFAIISEIKKLKKLFTFGAKYVIIYVENKER